MINTVERKLTKGVKNKSMPMQTKSCAQCNQECEKDQFPKKQWKREKPLCRLCFELTNISKEQTRQCKECKVVLPRNQYNVDQWAKGDKALCHGCRELVGQQILASFGSSTESNMKQLPDGTCVCSRHYKELCDECMMDFTLPNQFARMRTSVGRDLTKDEYEEQTKVYMEDSNIHINRKICIMDGQAICPRSGRKLRCPCNEVTYCSKDCQVYHWTIHKMTCKVQLEKAKKKKDKAAAKALVAQAQAAALSASAQPLNPN